MLTSMYARFSKIDSDADLKFSAAAADTSSITFQERTMHIGDFNDHMSGISESRIIDRHLDAAYASVERAVKADRKLTLLACLDGAISEAAKAQRMINFSCHYLDDAISSLTAARQRLHTDTALDIEQLIEAGGNLAGAKPAIRLRMTVDLNTTE